MIASRNVPDRADRFYDPHTDRGVNLDTVAVPRPQVHECGLLTIGARWNYRRVCSPFWRAYYNLGDGASIWANGREYALGPEAVVLLPDEVTYDCVPCSGVRHFWIHFSVDPWTDGLSRSEVTSVSLTSLERQAWGRLARDSGKAVDGWQGRSQLAARCFGLLVPLLGTCPGPRASSVSVSMRQLLVWLDDQMEAPPSVGEMADHVGMSRRAFIRWFQEEAGTSPAAWLTGRRIREACRLLRFGNQSVEQIASATGFANRHHFTRVFGAQAGVGPAAYRKRGGSP